MISRLTRRIPQIRLPRNRTVRLGAAAVVVVAAGFLIYHYTRPVAPADTVPVRRGRITATVEASGQVQAARDAWLSLRSSGIIKSISVKPGQQVNKGDVLVQADSADAERQVQEAELSLQIRQAQLDELRAAPTAEQIEIARANVRRAAAALQAAQAAYDQVNAQGKATGSSQATALESARLDYETAQAQFEQAIKGPSDAQIQVAEKNVQLAQIALDTARDNLDGTKIVAPFAGTVVQINAHEGETAYGVKAVRLVDLGTLEVSAQVDELDIGQLAEGQEAEIRLDAFPGQVFEGHVASLNSGATQQQGTVSYEAIISFSPGSVPVRPDMTATLKITTLTHDDTLLVPSRAVQARGRNKYVRVLQNGKPKDVRVTTGLSDDSDTEILDGVHEGQLVVVS